MRKSEDLYFKTNTRGLSDAINDKVGEFLKNGGKIKVIESGVSAEPYNEFKARIKAGNTKLIDNKGAM